MRTSPISLDNGLVLHSISGAAQLLGVSSAELRGTLDAEEIPTVTHDGRMMVTDEQVQALLRRLESQPE